MPYWLPSKNVTSRNAIFILEKKAMALKKGLAYLQDNRKSVLEENIGSGELVNSVFIQNVPAQSDEITERRFFCDSRIKSIFANEI